MAKRSKKKRGRNYFKVKGQNKSSNKAQKLKKKQVYKQSHINKFSYRLALVARKLKKLRKEEPLY